MKILALILKRIIKFPDVKTPYGSGDVDIAVDTLIHLCYN